MCKKANDTKQLIDIANRGGIGRERETVENKDAVLHLIFFSLRYSVVRTSA